MANTIYENFFLQNIAEDTYNSHLNLSQFCTVDNSLQGVAGMKKIINRYTASAGAQKLTMGVGNTQAIEASFTPVEYEIVLAQTRFLYYDEENKTDPFAVKTGINQLGVDIFNTVNADVIAEFNKTTNTSTASALNFDAFVDAAAKVNSENIEAEPLFALVNPTMVAALRKSAKDSLQYAESFIRTGYVGHLAGIPIYVSKIVTAPIVATKAAVRLLNKTGVEIEQERDANIRQNGIYARKYYLAALENETKAVKIVVS